MNKIDSSRGTLLPASAAIPISIILSIVVGLIVGLYVVFATPILPVIVIFGVILSIPLLLVIAKHPELGILGIVIITTGIIDAETLPLLSLGPISFHITDILLFFLLSIILIRLVRNPGFKLFPTPLNFLVAWYFVAVIVSAVVAVITPSLDVSWIFRMLRVQTYYLVFFAVTNLIQTKKSLQNLVYGLFWIAIIGSLAMPISAIFPSFSLIDTNATSLATADKVYYGVSRFYLAVDRLLIPMLLIAICSLALKGKWFSSIPLMVSILFLATGLLFTFQRNYWISFLLMFVLLGILVRWSGRLHLFGIALLAVGAFWFGVILRVEPFDQYVAAATDRLTFGIRSQTIRNDDSVQWRVFETENAVQSILAHPLLGIGLGNFYRPVTERDFPNINFRNYNHNAYFWVLINMGLFGFVPFVCLYGVAVLRGLTYWRKVSNLKWRVVLLGSTLGLLSAIISNYVAPNFTQTWSLCVYLILIGINELIIKWEVLQKVTLEENF